jgi:hypothetical protein
MDVKSFELYLLNDTLIKASVFYSEDKSDFWKSYYFENNYTHYMTASRGMRMSLDENGQVFVDVVNKLSKTKPK